MHTQTSNHTTYQHSNILKNFRLEQTQPLLSITALIQEKMIQSNEATVLNWSRVLQVKDKETEAHIQRVASLMTRLAKKMGFSEEEVRFAKWGAWIHDIGKVAIPDSILNKPGPLTEAESAIMREHPTIAYNMLNRVEFLRPALDIPHYHHEKWDGTGYPHGLKRTEIPLMARMFAVVDVYEALTNDRPYRKAWTQEKACTYLKEQAGKQFDPQIVNTFLAMISASAMA